MKKAATFCNGISRRNFLHSATLGTAAVASSSAFGLEASGGVDDTTELVVGCWGGATTDIIKRGVIHDLEQRYKARILIKEGTSGDRIAQLRASPNNPPLDVSHFSDSESLPLIEEAILDTKRPSDPRI
jgi:spermidine/putrescine-binding protein